jgi:CRP/FNR family transcriptional regulator
MQEATQPREVGGSDVLEWLGDPGLEARRLEIPETRILYHPPDPADSAYYLEAGQVRIYQIAPAGMERLAEILGARSWFGISALALKPTYEARSEAVAPTTVWAVPVRKLLAKIGERSELGVGLITQLASRLRAAHEAAARLMFEDTNERLVRTLIEFSQTSAAVPHEGGVLLHITHQQLAQAVGAARETVSLALTQLRHRSLLRTGRNRLMFDPAVLRAFSENLGQPPRPDSDPGPSQRQTSPAESGN